MPSFGTSVFNKQKPQFRNVYTQWALCTLCTSILNIADLLCGSMASLWRRALFVSQETACLDKFSLYHNFGRPIKANYVSVNMTYSTICLVEQAFKFFSTVTKFVVESHFSLYHLPWQLQININSSWHKTVSKQNNNNSLCTLSQYFVYFTSILKFCITSMVFSKYKFL